MLQRECARDNLDFRHPANAQELTKIAQQVSAQVLRGLVLHPGREAGLDAGDVDIEEFPMN